MKFSITKKSGTIERLGTAVTTNIGTGVMNTYSAIFLKDKDQVTLLERIGIPGVMDSFIKVGAPVTIYYMEGTGERLAIALEAEGTKLYDYYFLQLGIAGLKTTRNYAIMGCLMSLPLFVIVIGMVLLPFCLFYVIKSIVEINKLSEEKIKAALALNGFTY